MYYEDLRIFYFFDGEANIELKVWQILMNSKSFLSH